MDGSWIAGIILGVIILFAIFRRKPAKGRRRRTSRGGTYHDTYYRDANDQGDYDNDDSGSDDGGDSGGDDGGGGDD